MSRQRIPSAVIFDLDGVLVSTDAFHKRAWESLCITLGLDFDEGLGDALRGVSRQASLEMIYRHNEKPLPAQAEFEAQCARKNESYIQMVQGMSESDVLPGSVALLKSLRARGYRTALASASRNAPRVLDRTGLAALLDAVVDGTHELAPKPAPDVFLKAAELCRCDPTHCVGIEDAAAGIEAIRAAGMVAIGIGPSARAGAMLHRDTIARLHPDEVGRCLEQHASCR